MPKKELKNKITYGYYVDEDGLYFYSEKDGKEHESFSINGVASISLIYSDIEVLHLCYITNDDEDELDEMY
jgi:hypothetical protein